MFAAEDRTHSGDPEPQTLLWTLQWVHTGSRSPFLARCFRIVTFKKHTIRLSASQYFPLKLFPGGQLKNPSFSNNTLVLCEPKGSACGKRDLQNGTNQLHHWHRWTNQGFVEGCIYFAQLLPAGENPSFILSFGNAGFGTLRSYMFSCPHICFFRSETAVNTALNCYTPSQLN